MSRALHTYVALLRGINVGGNSTVPMATLRACFEQLGYQNVRTYINSGNVIFRADNTNPRSLEVTIEQALHARFSFAITVVVRTIEEIQTLLTHLPGSWHDANGLKCNVIFLRHTIDSPTILDNFAPKHEIEELHYHPGALLWSAETSSLTKSTMLKVNLMAMYKDMTVRILGSVRKIYALMEQIDQLPLR